MKQTKLLPDQCDFNRVTNPTKRILLQKIKQIYEITDDELFVKIITFFKMVSVNPDHLRFPACPGDTGNESEVVSQYSFNSTTAMHVFANHANATLGGGVFASGFVQEEQLLLRTTFLFPLYKCHFISQNELTTTNLETHSLLTHCNVYVHQDENLGLYSRKGMAKIAENPNIVDQFYAPHNTKPPIWILSKALPVKKWEYSDYVYKGLPIVDWMFHSALSAYIGTIEKLNDKQEVPEIVIHDGNWGCGVFNHNYNTVFVILHLAFRVACQVCKRVKPRAFVYHSVNEKTTKNLYEAHQLLKTISPNETVEDILNKIKAFHKQKHPYWSYKL